MTTAHYLKGLLTCLAVVPANLLTRDAALCQAAVVAAGLVTWLVIDHIEERRVVARLKKGMCPGCGYDLRATPDRCPECGHGGLRSD